MLGTLKTAFLLITLTLLLMLIGGIVAGNNGMILAFALSCGLNFAAYWFCADLVLHMHQAEPATEKQFPTVYRLVRKLTERVGLPMPQIYRMPINSPNAFATGRDPKHSVLAVTDGLIKLLTEEELEGVLAHELAHVIHQDILISAIAATFAGTISALASLGRWAYFIGTRGRGARHGNPLKFLIAVIVAPIAALLIQLSIARSREFNADESGAKLCGNPIPLATALRKMQSSVRRRPLQDTNPAGSHLFIVNPLRKDKLLQLFSTHPPMEERIARLKAMV